ncbi:MAG: hypothetical protein C4294_20005 [Nitrospiraceae bacterium]
MRALTEILYFVIIFMCIACGAQQSPAPSVVTGTLAPTVTPDPKLGSIKGVLMVRKDGAEKPVVNGNLYLADIKKDASGKEVGATFDRISSPRAFTDGEGRFMFSNVQPGRYGIVFDVIRNSYMLRQPTDGSDLIVTVTPGSQRDLGRLVYDSLPDA